MLLRSYAVAGLTCALLACPCRAQEGIPLPPIEAPPIRFVIPPVRGYPAVPVSSPSSAGGGTAPADPAVVAGFEIGVLALVIVVLVLALIACWRSCKVAYVRVVEAPPGEAPEAIRRAWVGVKLPLRLWQARAGTHRTEGVLSGRARESGQGYAVNGRAAVEALAVHSPEAAAWWRTNAPHVLAQGYRLWFPSDVGEPAG